MQVGDTTYAPDTFRPKKLVRSDDSLDVPLAHAEGHDRLKGMRICVATPLYPPQIGGPSSHCRMLEEALPDKGFSVSVIPFSSVLHYPKGIAHLIYTARLLRQAWYSDLIYSLDAVSVGMPTLVVATLLRKPFIVRIAGDQAWEQGYQRFKVHELLDEFSKKSCGFFWQKQSDTSGRFALYVCALKYIEQMVAKSAQKIIVPSRYMKSIVSNWGIDKTHIHVVYSHYDENPSSGNRKALRNLLQLDGKFLVSAGRLVPWKGFDTLITLMPELRKRFPDIKLMIAGDGPDAHRLASLIQELKLEDVVSLAGAVKKDTLLRYIEAADCFVLNTAYEGLSHQLLEVMDIGTPIVTTDVGGNPELLDTETSALLVSYNDTGALFLAITRVLESERFANHLIFHAKKKVARFSRDKVVPELVTTLQ